MKPILALLIFTSLLLGLNLSAQVAITADGSSAHPSAMLEVKSTDKGFLPPRMTTLERDVIQNPSVGLMIFNTDNNRIELYTDLGWAKTCKSPSLFYELYDNAALNLSGAATWTDFPGHVQALYVAADTDFEIISTISGRLLNSSNLFARIVINGTPHSYLRATATGTWVTTSISGRVTLSSGNHEIKVQYRSGSPIEFGGSLDYTTRYLLIKEL